MVNIRYSIRMNTKKTLHEVKKEVNEMFSELKNITITRNIGDTINIQIKTNKPYRNLKNRIQIIGKVELFHMITGKAV